MESMTGLLLLLVLAAVYVSCQSTIVSSNSMCVNYNPYSFEVYKIMVSKPRDACEDGLTRNGHNPIYCSSSSVQTLNIIQTDNEQRSATKYNPAGISQAETSTVITSKNTASVSGSLSSVATTVSAITSGSGDNTINKCHFDVSFFFDDGTILGGDVAIYKFASTNESYEIIVYSKSKDDLVKIGSSEVKGEQTGWNTVQINEFMSGFGTGDIKTRLAVQFVRGGEEITCQEAQSAFITDCSKSVQIDIPPNPPAIVVMSQRESQFLRRLRNRRVARQMSSLVEDNALYSENEQQKNGDCMLRERRFVPGKLSRRLARRMVAPTEINIGQCVNASNQECAPKETKDLHIIVKNNRKSLTIETIPSLVATKC